MNVEITRALRECATLFERMDIRYVVMGGFAVRAYAMPRPTFDVDFTIGLLPERLDDLFAALDALGYTVSETYRRGWLDRVGGMPLVKARFYVGNAGSYGIDIDIFLAESPYQQILLTRRQRGALDDGEELWFVSAEDLILLKLIAGRPKDFLDVADVLFTQGQLDTEYMRRWASEFGVTERLDDALRSQLDGP